VQILQLRLHLQILKKYIEALRKMPQVGFQPGSMMLTAFGANAGGPITVQGMNTSAGQAFGDIN